MEILAATVLIFSSSSANCPELPVSQSDNDLALNVAQEFAREAGRDSDFVSLDIRKCGFTNSYNVAPEDRQFEYIDLTAILRDREKSEDAIIRGQIGCRLDRTYVGESLAKSGNSCSIHTYTVLSHDKLRNPVTIRGEISLEEARTYIGQFLHSIGATITGVDVTPALLENLVEVSATFDNNTKFVTAKFQCGNEWTILEATSHGSGLLLTDMRFRMSDC